MIADGPFASMFNRRVALLCAVAGLALAVPVVRLFHLTLVKGDRLRAEAESKLIAQRWESTTRGRIYDRKGRLLAADRPSFDIAVEYPVITGEWAFLRAADEARKTVGADWRKLSPPQRVTKINELAPKWVQRLDEAWSRFARTAGISEEELEQRKSAIIADVSRQFTNVLEARRQAREDAINRESSWSDDAPYAQVSAGEVEAVIREQRVAHVILHEVADEVAARFPLTDSPGARGKRSTDEDWMPGLRLIDGSGREYPFQSHQVVIDRASFPGPLKSDSPLMLTPTGVMTQIIGWMRTRPLDQDYWWRDQVAGGADPTQRRTASEEDLQAWMEQRALDRKAGLTPAPDPMGYFANDSTGAMGVEWSMEQRLRGRRGYTIEQLDTRDQSNFPRQTGGDVRLTIDAHLQARVQALMSPEAGLAVVQPWQKNRALPEGTTLNGAAVVIEVATGDILAMVSTPTFTLDQVRDNPQALFDPKGELPTISKAFSRPYPPGSIVKPLMYCAAVAEGIWDIHKRVECTGHLYPDKPTMLRCWIYKNPPHSTHTVQMGGPLDVTNAIMGSCNIYFYTVGRTLGPSRISQWYHRFGVGRTAQQPQLGLGILYAGTAGKLADESTDDDLPDSDLEEIGAPPRSSTVRSSARRTMLSLSEATLMGIGQGPVAWTPLHAADSYATLARGGTRILPRIREDQPAVTDDLRIPPAACAMALEGLRKSVSERLGTGYQITIESTGQRENIFNAPGLTVWGKSGTADSGTYAKNAAGQRLLDEHGRPISIDHAWFVVLAGPKGGTPKYAVALMVERGGSGGRVSGPLCNQILHALIAEGYLP